MIFAAVADAGVDYLHIASEGRNFIDTARLHGRPHDHRGGQSRSPVFPSSPTAGCTTSGKPTDVLDDGHADLLSIGRGALANPDLPARLADGVELEPFDHAMLSPMATISNARSWRVAQDAH